MQISVIIPILNEEKALPSLLRQVARWDCVDEVLFVDGGSTDGTLALLDGRVVLSCGGGRGAQCRLGAERAQGDAFVFVHADSSVSADSMQAIRAALESGVSWGCLTLRFESKAFSMHFAARASNLRVRLSGIPFGDQVMFMTREIYEQVGGMPDLALMEDYELSRRLRSVAWPKQLREKVYTSSRRFEKGGSVRTMLQMRHLRHLYRKGADIQVLVRKYSESRGRIYGE